MRLSEFLELSDAKKLGIALIGYYKTSEGEFAVIARKGDNLFPFPKMFYLIEVKPANSDPEIHEEEQRSIFRRFRYFSSASTSPSPEK